MSERFLSAEWRYLVMLNYEVDPSVLRHRVPRGTELDSWKEKNFVSVVGFRFLRTRVLGLPFPFHRNFDEVNLRFYVRREHPGGLRRGVVFVKEIVPRTAIAWVARTVFNENYVSLPMRHWIRPPEVSYQWRQEKRWNKVGARIEGEPCLPDEKSEEAFITEHYWGYSRQRGGSTIEYRVEHPRWNVWRTVEAELDCDVSRVYGAELSEFLQGKPSSAFVADGSPVVVRRATPLDRES